MSEELTVLKISNVKKRYMIKHIGKRSENKSERAKLAVKHFFKPNMDKEEFWALNGVAFDVKKGEKVGIIGKNGAGKSTLLKIISRITEPTDGRIEILGKISSMLEVGTGFNQELTGRENVYLNGAILGMTKKEIDEKFDDILEFSEVGKFIDTPVKRYSSGMFVRLAFSVASHLEPDILLVDEVLSVGDTRFQKKCIDRMKAIAESGITILYVSHQLQTIRQLCDRVIVLKDGQIIHDGDVEKGIEIYSDSIDVSSTKIDCLNRKLRGTQILTISAAEILDRERCEWLYNEPIKIRINITANDDCCDPKFILRICDINGSALGKAESKPLGNLKKGNQYSFDLIFDAKSILSPNKYIACFELWEFVGKNITIHDVTPEAFTFEILSSDDNHPDIEPLNWNANWFGTIMLPDIDINPVV